jgi:arabinoxylan arabinofuranohydrolase
MKPTPTLAILAATATHLYADFPIASQRYLADPSTLVTKDRVYVYCSNDDESPVEGSYNIPNVVCLSSSDMKNWTDHGVVFDAARDTSWAKKTWAPCAAERDGKFYLYFGNGGGNIGVVVGDTPVGPFKDVKKSHLIDGGTPGVQPFQGGWLFDPGVFIDDDGQAYIYFGGNGDDKARVAKLNRDMISLDGEVMKMNVPHFFEAAWVFKHKGTYYYGYSTTPKAAMRIDYLISKKPDRDFTYGGIIAEQPPINNNNNHAAQFQFKDQWYHIYHNRNVAKQAGIPTGFRRNIALERFSFNDDGTIKKVEYTKDGPPQVGHVNPFAKVEAETFADQKGIETEPCSAGGMNVCNIENGDWITIKGVDFGTKGAKRFAAKAASETQGGKIELRLGGPDGTLVGTCEVTNTGGWQSWKNSLCEIKGANGVQDLCLKFTGNEGFLLNLDSWIFQ